VYTAVQTVDRLLLYRRQAVQQIRFTSCSRQLTAGIIFLAKERGNKAATDEAYKELKGLSEQQILDLVEQTKTSR
jgi:hypothetical protein